jgi:hypothetical protein
VEQPENQAANGENKIMEGRIVNKDKINIIYRHVTPTNTVVAVGIWTQKK